MRTFVILVAFTLAVTGLGCDIPGTEDAPPTPTAVELFLSQTAPLLTQLQPIDSDVVDAMATLAAVANAPWEGNAFITQAEAVRPGRAKFTNLDNMTTSEIQDALNRKSRPFIPAHYRRALEDAVAKLEQSIAELQSLTDE